MIYVTDTHPFLWYLADDARLSQRAREAFDDAEMGDATIIVPTVALAEAVSFKRCPICTTG